MSIDGHHTKWRKNDENFNRMSRVHEHFRRQTDALAIAYNERSPTRAHQEMR